MHPPWRYASGISLEAISTENEESSGNGWALVTARQCPVHSLGMATGDMFRYSIDEGDDRHALNLCI